MKLTATRIDALSPRPARYEVADPACAGLRLRIMPTGAKSWNLRFVWRGKRQRLSLGSWPDTTLRAAREAAAAARTLLARGIDPRTAERLPAPRRRAAAPAPEAEPLPRHSIENLAAEFMALFVEPQRKQPEYVRRILDTIVLPNWRHRDARTIKPREVVELLDDIVGRGSPIMANRTAGVLSQMFRFGVHRAIVDSSPVQLLYRPGGKEKPRDRALTDAELRAFVVNLDAVMRSARTAHVLRILLATGQRRGEIARARWSDLDLEGEAPTWSIPAEHSKTGVAHVVPLSPFAVREFRALRAYAGRSPFVFPADGGKVAADAKLLTRSVSRCEKRFEKAGIAPFTVHDLRRACRTGLAKLRVADEVAERVLNHSLSGMRGVYNRHDYLPEMREALNRWGAHLEAIEAGL